VFPLFAVSILDVRALMLAHARSIRVHLRRFRVIRERS
jgi:hypothetical protein